MTVSAAPDNCGISAKPTRVFDPGAIDFPSAGDPPDAVIGGGVTFWRGRGQPCCSRARRSRTTSPVRVELSADLPPKNKNNFFFDHLRSTTRTVELFDEDASGHVPVKF